MRRYQKVTQQRSAASQGIFDAITINCYDHPRNFRTNRNGNYHRVFKSKREEAKRSSLSCCSGDQSVRPFIISIFEASLSKEHRGRRRRRHCRHSLKYRQPPSSPLSTKEKGRSGRPRPVFGREPNRTEPIKYYIVVASPFGRSVMSR